MSKHTPGPCIKCKQPRRLNTLGFLCDCPLKNHEYLAYQFPLYPAAPEAACEAQLAWIENLQELSAELSIADEGDEQPHIDAFRAAIAKAKGQS